MKQLLPVGLLSLVLILSACSQAPSTNEPVACPEDAKLCPDGSSVGRVGPNCEFAACPEPSTETNLGTFKEYKSTDAEQCKAMRFTCGDTGEYFGDDTGCGCVLPHTQAAVTLCAADYDPVCGWSDPEKIQCFAYPCAQTYSNLCMASIEPNVASTTPGECPPVGSSPDRKYVSTNQTQCAASMWLCVEGMQQFYDETGCGCEPKSANPSTGMPVKLEAVDCPAERQQACTREYMPVCGQQVLNTGDVVTKTYGNKCEACAEMKVVSYTQGACFSDFATYSYQPMQCEEAPWDEWYKTATVQFVKAPTEEELIVTYYGSKNVEVTDVTKVESGNMVCQACNVCPTTYSFTLRVNVDNGDSLEEDGWTLVPQKY